MPRNFHADRWSGIAVSVSKYFPGAESGGVRDMKQPDPVLARRRAVAFVQVKSRDTRPPRQKFDILTDAVRNDLACK